MMRPNRNSEIRSTRSSNPFASVHRHLMDAIPCLWLCPFGATLGGPIHVRLAARRDPGRRRPVDRAIRHRDHVAARQRGSIHRWTLRLLADVRGDGAHRLGPQVHELVALVVAPLGIACSRHSLFLIDYAARLLRPISILARRRRQRRERHRIGLSAPGGGESDEGVSSAVQPEPPRPARSHRSTCRDRSPPENGCSSYSGST